MKYSICMQCSQYKKMVLNIRFLALQVFSFHDKCRSPVWKRFCNFYLLYHIEKIMKKNWFFVKVSTNIMKYRWNFLNMVLILFWKHCFMLNMIEQSKSFKKACLSILLLGATIKMFSFLSILTRMIYHFYLKSYS